MDALAYLTSRASIAPDTARTRRTILNDTFRALRELRPRVTQIVYDPEAMLRLRDAGRLPRTLLHPALPGFKK